MSLFGALSVGGSSLAAQQAGLQVTGNNIANAGTDGYSRQVVNLAPTGPVDIGSGQLVGTGVGIVSIERQVNAALDESLRTATSDQSSAQTTDNLLSRLEATFNALGDNSLSTRLNTFFGNFSTLANNPSDTAQRSVVVQNGVSLAGYLQSLRTQVNSIRDDAQNQIDANVKQADGLLHTVASLNLQITNAEGGTGGMANNLRDQRDQALKQLSQLMDVKVIDQGGGNVNVLIGSLPVVTGTTTRGLTTQLGTDPTGQFSVTNVVFADTKDPATISSGKIGSLVSTRDNYLSTAIQSIDTMASGLINAVNSIHSQGQGLSGFSSVTGATQVLDPTAALNAATTTTGIAFPPVNGTFNLYIKDTVSGQTTTQQINVNLSGQGTQTTLNSLAASITGAGGGVISATVNPNGTLAIASNNKNVTFSFGEDTSGALASLGINTFFTGKDAATIAVNSVIRNNNDLLATARSTSANGNAQAMALAGAATVPQLGGKSLTDYYSNYIGDLASHAKNATDDFTAQSAIHDTLYSQQQAISGVSMDEEAINLTKYQRAFQGSARFITVIDQMMQTVLGMLA